MAVPPPVRGDRGDPGDCGGELRERQRDDELAGPVRSIDRWHASFVLAATASFVLVFGLMATLNTANAVLIEIGYFKLRRREP